MEHNHTFLMFITNNLFATRNGYLKISLHIIIFHKPEVLIGNEQHNRNILFYLILHPSYI